MKDISIQEAVFSLFEMHTGISESVYMKNALRDLSIESLGFINFIVDIENTLNVRLPEEFLSINELPDLYTFAEMVQNIYSQQNK